MVMLMRMLLFPLKCVWSKEELSQYYFSSLKKFYWSVLVYNMVLVTGVWQSKSVTHIHIFTPLQIFFSHIGHY